MKKLVKMSAIALAVAGVSSAAQAAEINVVSWGGAYTASQKNAEIRTRIPPGRVKLMSNCVCAGSPISTTGFLR